MKYLFFISLLLLSIVVITATPVLKLQNTNPQPKETFIGTISTDGKFLETLSKDDIKFYEGRKQVYFDYNLYYFEGTYYLSIVFNREGEFTLKTKEILYNLAGEVGSKQIEKNISVKYTSFDNQTNEGINILEIKPGIIYTISNKSKISLFNRGNNDLSIKIDDISFTLGAYQAKTINLNLVEPLSFIDISTYKSFSIPVIYLSADTTNKSPSENSTTIIESSLTVSPGELEIYSVLNSSINQIIYLENNGENNITSIQVKTDIKQAKINAPYSIESNSTSNITIQIFSGDTSKNKSIEISYIENQTEFKVSIPITIIIELSNDTTPINNNLLCSDLGGKICNEKCEGESNFTSDGYCCYGNCVPLTDETATDNSSSSSTKWIVGLLIFILIGIIGYLVYKKYKKTTPETPKEKIETSKKHYENRIQGGLTRH